MSTRPPVPRRSIPPPLPIDKGVDSDEFGGLAARIAALAKAPPVPSRGSRQFEKRSSMTPLSETPDLARLLARRPPPPPLPSRRSSTPVREEAPPPPARPPLPKRRTTQESSIYEEPPPPARRRLPPPPDPSRNPPPPIINTASRPMARQVAPPPPHLPAAMEGSCLKCKNFGDADAHAAQFPRETVGSLEELAYNLTAPFDDEVDKARVIFTWLHHNIAYNTEAFFSGNLKPSTPQSTLSSGLAVCEGYAGLFTQLATLAGLESHTVNGHGKGFGYSPLQEGEPLPEMSANHAWNCVRLNDEWHLIDSCWGAGAVTNTFVKGFNPLWFYSTPEEFGLRHFPSDPSFFLTPEAKSWEEYILASPGLLTPAIVQELGFNPFSISPDVNKIPGNQYTYFRIAKLCEHLSVSDSDNYPMLIKSGEERFPLEFNAEEHAWTATILTPPDGQVQLFYVDTIGGQDALGVTHAQYKRAQGRQMITFKGIASWEVI